MVTFGFNKPPNINRPLTRTDKFVVLVTGITLLPVFGIVFVEIVWAALQNILGLK